MAIRDFLYFDSTLTATQDCADIDDYDLINLRDLLYLYDHLGWGQSAPVCTTGHSRIVPSPSLTHRIEHTSLVPANATSIAVLFRLSILNEGVARAVNLAVSLTVEGIAPSIDSVNAQMDWSFGWVSVEPAGAPSGSLKAGFLELFGAQPGSSDLLTAHITIDPKPYPRAITVDYLDFPPIIDDQFGVPRPVQYTMILDNGYAAWVPDSAHCPIWNTGDVNADLALTASDVIATVNYVFKGGFEPFPCPASADVNCSGAVTSSDVINLVNHVFKGGPAPCDVCTLIPETWGCTP